MQIILRSLSTVRASYVWFLSSHRPSCSIFLHQLPCQLLAGFIHGVNKCICVCTLSLKWLQFVLARGQYNYSEETLTGQIPCSHCRKKFKVQGLKKHETSCKKRLETKDEMDRFNREYEKGQQTGEQPESLSYYHSNIYINIPSTKKSPQRPCTDQCGRPIKSS